MKCCDGVIAALAVVAGCSGPSPAASTTAAETSGISTSATSSESGAVESSSGGTSTGVNLDSLPDTGNLGCAGDGHCTAIDLLFVIDNSGTMGEEQLNLAANFPLLVDQLQNLTDEEGNPINASVNVMVTTTDFGHPLCTKYQKDDYTPRRGAPVYEGCNARKNRFTGLGDNDPLVVEEACTTNCPVDIAPGDQFLWFDGDGNSNSPDPAKALACIGPQGIDGCGYEAPLETMLQALNPESCWNDPGNPECQADPEWSHFDKPFLRPDAMLAIVIVTDETDCSVASPDGYGYFTQATHNEYWETNPHTGEKSQSSAICWNAGVTCTGPDAEGNYGECVSAVNDVLHPTARYVEYLKYLAEKDEKEVVMLGILGVPEVTQHNPAPPYEPTMGGVYDLEYRRWQESDIPPAEAMSGVEVEDKVWEFGDIAPGCSNDRGLAIFPTRVQEVCQSLDVPDNPATEEIDNEVHCCIESICSSDFSPAVRCLTGAISKTIPEVG